jgi:hypothetical protein
LTGKGTKLITVVLVAVILVSALGYLILAPKTPYQVVTFTYSEETSTIATSSVGVTSTTLSFATILWINITATKSVSFYLALLESNRTEPYVQLAKELRKLPDFSNATAVAKIAYLALNATNPEVKEAFELMMKGGTPDPRDFTYTVPNYNTELQVLYWLALQNEFKKDDTLALALAMVNGLWITMGDDQVRDAVIKDTDGLLSFGRETAELQNCRTLHTPLTILRLIRWKLRSVGHGLETSLLYPRRTTHSIFSPIRSWTWNPTSGIQSVWIR